MLFQISQSQCTLITSHDLTRTAAVCLPALALGEIAVRQAQGRARHANVIHPADEATGQVDATHPPQRDAMEGAIAGHERIQWYM